MNPITTLKRNHEFQRLYAKGTHAANPHLALYCRKARGQRNRVGFTVGKKVGGAVVRNRVRRKLREIYRLHSGEMNQTYDIVVVARVRAAHSNYQQLERAFVTLSKKVGLIGDKP